MTAPRLTSAKIGNARSLRELVEECLKDAYADGYSDGERYGNSGSRRSPKMWIESVTGIRKTTTVENLILAAIQNGGAE